MKTKPQEKHKMAEIDEGISKIFEIKKRLGKGAYGIVWKAIDKRSTETIAVKKIFDAFRDETDAQRTFREIIFLKAFCNHPNVIRMLSIHRASNNLDIYLVFEFMESDLHNIIKKGTILKDIHKRYVMYQLFNAIKYIHSGNVIHRDLKPSNVLIDSKCRCKLADFGLARSVAKRQSRDANGGDVFVDPLLTDYVATRWYRAPEILVASKRYTKGIDMWSLGCILAEMIRGKPLFQGTSTINQIERIICAMPDITENEVNAVGPSFGSILLNRQIPKERKTSIEELLPTCPDDALNLIKSLLVLDPLARVTAKSAITHIYVSRFRNSMPEVELTKDIIPPVRDDVRLTVPEYRTKLYEMTQDSKGLQRRHADKNTINKQKKFEVYGSLERTEHKRVIKSKPSNIRNQKEEVEALNINNNLTFTKSRHSKQKSTPSSSTHKVKSIKSTKLINVLSDMKVVQKSSGRITPPQVQTRTKSRSRNVQSDSNSKSPQKLRSYSKERRSTSDLSNNKNVSLSAKDLKRPSSHRKKYHRIVQCKIGHITPGRGGPAVRRSLRRGSRDRINRSTPIVSTNKIRNKAIRNTKSDVMPGGLKATPPEERICYEKKLKILEEEIEKYKNEVKSLCRETFRVSSNRRPNVISIPSQHSQPNIRSSASRSGSRGRPSLLPTPKKISAQMHPLKSAESTKINNSNKILVSDKKMEHDKESFPNDDGGSGDHIGHDQHKHHSKPVLVTQAVVLQDNRSTTRYQQLEQQHLHIRHQQLTHLKKQYHHEHDKYKQLQAQQQQILVQQQKLLQNRLAAQSKLQEQPKNQQEQPKNQQEQPKNRSTKRQLLPPNQISQPISKVISGKKILSKFHFSSSSASQPSAYSTQQAKFGNRTATRFI